MHKKIDSLYLHFPFCSHLCNYCDFYKKVPTSEELDFNQFQTFLENSFTEHEKLIKAHGYQWAELKTFYIGGGTPSLWGVKGKSFLNKFLESKNIKLSKDCEFTIEVNPKTWTEASINEWMDLGVNRFSIGVQTLDPKLFPLLDRSHGIEDIYLTLDFFKKLNVNFSVDFMLGLPRLSDEKRDVIAEMQKAFSYQPSHFSVYILTVKNNYKYFHLLPDEEAIENEFLMVADFLASKTFEHYEVSNFCLPGKASKHNLNYWKSNTVAALGPSATGYLSEDKIRYKWKTNSASMEQEFLTDEQVKLEEIYLKLRTNIGLNISSFPNDKFRPIYQNWQSRNLIKIINDQIYLTSKGYLLLDSFIDELFKASLL